jgi:hypothetical protein
MVTTKSDVKFGGFTSGLIKILYVVNKVASTYPMMITSGSEGTHLPNSRHYTFEAVDVRSNWFKPDIKPMVKALLEMELGSQFTVLLENENGPNEHFHIQVRYGHKYVESVDAGSGGLDSNRTNGSPVDSQPK